jgi:hypothetical protein
MQKGRGQQSLGSGHAEDILRLLPGMKIRVSLVVLSCVLSIITGLVLARGGAEKVAQGAGRVRIGLSMDTLKEERWQGDRDMFVKRADGARRHRDGAFPRIVTTRSRSGKSKPC